MSHVFNYTNTKLFVMLTGLLASSTLFGQLYNHKALIDDQNNLGGTSIRYSSYGATGMSYINAGDFDLGFEAINGCIRQTQASSFSLDAAIDLPHGTKIVSITFDVYDGNNGAPLISGSLFEFNANSFTTVFTTSVPSNTNNGYIGIGGFLDDYRIDNINHNYIVARLSSNTNVESRLCGVRIGYVPANLADDVIFVNNFYR